MDFTSTYDDAQKTCNILNINSGRKSGKGWHHDNPTDGTKVTGQNTVGWTGSTRPVPLRKGPRVVRIHLRRIASSL